VRLVVAVVGGEGSPAPPFGLVAMVSRVVASVVAVGGAVMVELDGGVAARGVVALVMPVLTIAGPVLAAAGRTTPMAAPPRLPAMIDPITVRMGRRHMLVGRTVPVIGTKGVVVSRCLCYARVHAHETQSPLRSADHGFGSPSSSSVRYVGASGHVDRVAGRCDDADAAEREVEIGGPVIRDEKIVALQSEIRKLLEQVLARGRRDRTIRPDATAWSRT
jgi:hypothetical protein